MCVGARRNAALACLLVVWLLMAFVVECLFSVLLGPVTRFIEYVYTKESARVFSGVFVGCVLSQCIFIPFAFQYNTTWVLPFSYVCLFGFALGHALAGMALHWNNESPPLIIDDYCECFRSMPAWLTLFAASNYSGLLLGLFFAYPHLLHIPPAAYMAGAVTCFLGMIGGLVRVGGERAHLKSIEQKYARESYSEDLSD